MSILFETTTINGLEIPNRFVRSATWMGMATHRGAVTPALIKTMVDLAKGGVGLIISGHAHVDRQGQAGPWQMGIYGDDLLPGLSEMVDAVHHAGGKIVAQLAHAGFVSPPELTRMEPLAPSAPEEEGEPGKTMPREMTLDDIGRAVEAFAQAGKRARRAGFDGVQIHSAHGYLLSQFLSPLFNRRQDDYGGSIENRTRFHIRVLAAIRGEVGRDYPVMIKINGQDFAEGGLTAEDSARATALLETAGLDAVEISGGMGARTEYTPARAAINKPEKEAYHRPEAEEFRKRCGLPLILVGGVRSPEVAEEIIKSGAADYLALCRPLIREPGLIKRWAEGDTRPALCGSDNLCFKPGSEGKGVYCITAEKQRRKAEAKD